jgi:hypothetical protein
MKISVKDIRKLVFEEVAKMREHAEPLDFPSQEYATAMHKETQTIFGVVRQAIQQASVKLPDDGSSMYPEHDLVVTLIGQLANHYSVSADDINNVAESMDSVMDRMDLYK